MFYAVLQTALFQKLAPIHPESRFRVLAEGAIRVKNAFSRPYSRVLGVKHAIRVDFRFAENVFGANP